MIDAKPEITQNVAVQIKRGPRLNAHLGPIANDMTAFEPTARALRGVYS